MRLLLALFGIGITVLAYALSRIVGKRYPSPLTSPVFFSTPLVIAVLLLSGMHLSDYQPAKDIIVSLLGPRLWLLPCRSIKTGRRSSIICYPLPSGLP